MVARDVTRAGALDARMLRPAIAMALRPRCGVTPNAVFARASSRATLASRASPAPHGALLQPRRPRPSTPGPHHHHRLRLLHRSRRAAIVRSASSVSSSSSSPPAGVISPGADHAGLPKNFEHGDDGGAPVRVVGGARMLPAGLRRRQSASRSAIAMPPPNVTGALHMGHAMFVTLQDIMARERADARAADACGSRARTTPGIATQTLVPIRSRSRGERRTLRTLPGVSLRPGSLAFNPRPRRLSTPLLTPFNSTPTSVGPPPDPQRVVERALEAEVCTTRMGIGREAFETADVGVEGGVRRTHRGADTTARRVVRLDPRAVHAGRRAERRGAGVLSTRNCTTDGLIYKGTYMVNWAPKLQTAVS